MSGTHIWVTVCEVDRGKIRLGFDASRCVTIEREEVVGMRRNGAAPEPIKTKTETKVLEGIPTIWGELT